MANNKKTMCSRGMHTSDSHLQPQSSDNSDTEHEIRQRQLEEHSSNDGDQSTSTISVPHALNPPRNFAIAASDPEEPLYKMSAWSSKNHCDHPSTFCFEKITPGGAHPVDHRRRRSYYMQGAQSGAHQVNNLRHHRRHPRAQNKSIQEPTADHHQTSRDAVSSESSQVFHQHPRSLRWKCCNMFSCLRTKMAKPKSDAPEATCDIEANHDDELEARNDIFYVFDHGNKTFYKTTDNHPQLYSDQLAKQTMHHATRFWAEFFGTINVAVTFLIAFFIQFFRFILNSVVLAVIEGALQTMSDYLLKPILATFFNGFLQPLFTLVQNIFESFYDMLVPVTNTLASVLTAIFQPFTTCLGAVRLVEYKNINITKLERPPDRPQNFSAQV